MMREETPVETPHLVGIHTTELSDPNLHTVLPTKYQRADGLEFQQIKVWLEGHRQRPQGYGSVLRRQAEELGRRSAQERPSNLRMTYNDERDDARGWSVQASQGMDEKREYTDAQQYGIISSLFVMYLLLAQVEQATRVPPCLP